MGWVVSDLGYGFAHVWVAVGLVGGEDVLEASGAGVCEFDHVLLLCAGSVFGYGFGGLFWCCFGAVLGWFYPLYSLWKTCG